MIAEAFRYGGGHANADHRRAAIDYRLCRHGGCTSAQRRPGQRPLAEQALDFGPSLCRGGIGSLCRRCQLNFERLA